MGVYTTVLGDTWDMIAKKVYGNEARADKLMDANRELLEEVVFSAGIKINCPDTENYNSGIQEVYPEWRIQ